MSYPIQVQLIEQNRSNEPLTPQGIVYHSTDTPNATAQNEHDYFNSGYRGASAHYFVDWGNIIQTIPDNEVSWGAGQTANHKYLNIELCEPTDPTLFEEVWKRGVWLGAYLCVKYGWKTGPDVWSHAGVAGKWGETNHNDPYPFFERFGKTWSQFLADMDQEIENIKGGVKVEEPKKVIAPDDIYLSVRVHEDLADQAIKDINKLGFAAKRLDLA